MLTLKWREKKYLLVSCLCLELTDRQTFRNRWAGGCGVGGGADPYQGVGDDEGHPADEQEGA